MERANSWNAFISLHASPSIQSNSYLYCLKSWHLATYRKTTILVKKGEEKVINTIESWLNDGTNADEKQIDAWCDEGLVFRSTPLGVRAMHLAEVKEKKVYQTIRKPSMLKFALDLYVQAGTERYDLSADLDFLKYAADLVSDYSYLARGCEG